MTEPAPTRICHHCGHAASSPEERTCPKHDLVLIDEAEHAKDPVDPFLGRTLGGRYPIIGIIGAGGMGSVYRAIQEPVGRQVALKVIRNTGDDKLAMRERFELEAQVIAKLQHPNTVTLHDYGVHDDMTLYMVLELIDGRPLTHKIRSGPMPMEDTASIMASVLDALVEAHAFGLVHRDLKPDNIMLAETAWGQEHVKVLDFGVAKVMGKEGENLTQSGTAVGTVSYMSPEQIQGRPGLDARSDLYAAGIILYECLAGRRPFDSPNQVEVMAAHIQKKPDAFDKALGVSPAMSKVVMQALAKRANRRFPDARAMATALRSAVGLSIPVVSAEVQAPPAPEPKPAATTAELGRGELGALLERPRRRWAAIAGIAAVALGAGISFTALLSGDEGPTEPTAPEAANAQTETPTPPEASPPKDEPPPPPLFSRKLISEPPGAQIYEDDRFLGSAPLRLDLEPGVASRRFEIRLSGMRTVETTMDRSEAGDLRVRMEAVAAPPPKPPKAKKRKRKAKKRKAKKRKGRQLLGID